MFLQRLFASIGSSAGTSISAADLAQRVQAGESLVVIDVREPSEYRTGHVPGSRNIPLGQVAQRAAELPASGPVYLICRSGGRSGQAASQLAGHGFEPINVSGGMMAYPGPTDR
jgi:rhodanese-related sulfurtransferase